MMADFAPALFCTDSRMGGLHFVRSGKRLSNSLADIIIFYIKVTFPCGTKCLGREGELKL